MKGVTMNKENLTKLLEPFAPEDIEWRVQQSGIKNDKAWAMVLAYVQNRAVQQRLDDVCGPENWKNKFETAPDSGVMCGISIKIGDEWIDKWDGAENTQIEAVKGGLSGAMKRSAVQWGIGRYLYKLETVFVQVSDKGQHYIGVKENHDDKYPKIKGYWNDPQLPTWALPKDTAVKKSAKVEKFVTDNQKQLIMELLEKRGVPKEEMPSTLSIQFDVPIGTVMRKRNRLLEN